MTRNWILYLQGLFILSILPVTLKSQNVSGVENQTNLNKLPEFGVLRGLDENSTNLKRSENDKFVDNSRETTTEYVQSTKIDIFGNSTFTESTTIFENLVTKNSGKLENKEQIDSKTSFKTRKKSENLIKNVTQDESEKLESEKSNLNFDENEIFKNSQVEKFQSSKREKSETLVNKKLKTPQNEKIENFQNLESKKIVKSEDKNVNVSKIQNTRTQNFKNTKYEKMENFESKKIEKIEKIDETQNFGAKNSENLENRNLENQKIKKSEESQKSVKNLETHKILANSTPISISTIQNPSEFTTQSNLESTVFENFDQNSEISKNLENTQISSFNPNELQIPHPTSPDTHQPLENLTNFDSLNIQVSLFSNFLIDVNDTIDIDYLMDDPSQYLNTTLDLDTIIGIEPTVSQNITKSIAKSLPSRSIQKPSSSEYHWPNKQESVVEGDVILGGLMMVHEREDNATCGPIMPQGGIQALEAMLFTLDRINEMKLFGPDVKIGALILDDCDKDTYGLEMAVDFIKGELSVFFMDVSIF